MHCKSYFILYVTFFTVTQRLCRMLPHFLINFEQPSDKIKIFFMPVRICYMLHSGVVLIREYLGIFVNFLLYVCFVILYILCTSFVCNQNFWCYHCYSGRVITWPNSVPFIFSAFTNGVASVASDFAIVLVSVILGQCLFFMTFIVWWTLFCYSFNRKLLTLVIICRCVSLLKYSSQFLNVGNVFYMFYFPVRKPAQRRSIRFGEVKAISD